MKKVFFKRREFIHALAFTPTAGRLLGSPGGSQKTDKLSPHGQKLVLIGAGSAVFTRGIIIDWLLRRPEGEWESTLVDINPVVLRIPVNWPADSGGSGPAPESLTQV